MKLSRWAYFAAIGSHLLLIVLMLVRDGFGASTLLVLPLLLPLPGLLRGREYTYGWASMLLTFYVGSYLASGYAEPAQKWAAFGIAAVAAIDFVSLALYVRLGQRERAGSAARTAASDAASR